MLSIENPPPDPSCSCQLFTQLKNTTNSDENIHKLALPELDLLNPPLDHHHNLNLPKFSIRDYVFTSRSKDIKKNWPFSLKNLQLCLKHGVKDVLPPFQALGSVKIQSCTVDETNNSLGEKKNISNFDGEPSSGPNNNALLLDSSNNAQLLKHKLQSASIDTSSCRSASAAENDFPSTTTSVSLSEIESVRPSCSPLEPDTLLEAASVSASASVEAAVHPSSRKTENTIRPPGGKKCRLIVKFGSNSDRSSNEDIASNSTAVSETMTSKVCPVCKIFTSSSNTTLNAHIDQCLSAESPPKWTADSKLTRHRIKPRKTRLMEDIYVTARHCTLEELDRRNGTNWATVSSFPPWQDNEKLENMPAGEVKRQRMSQLHPEDAGGEVGEVYIDSTGTKLRILSKSNDAPPAVSKEVEDLQPMKEVKESKFISTKKKRRHARKHLKYLKLAPQSRKFFSHKTRASQICGGQEGDYGVEESSKKEKHQSEKQINSNDCGTLRQWVCSKRTGLAKKVSNQDGHQPFRCKWHLARDLLVENHQSSLGESIAERNRVQKYANLSENPTSSPEISEKWERSSGGKRAGSPLLGARLSDATERSLPPMKQNGSKDSSFIHGSLTFEPSNSNRNCVSSLNNKRAGIQGGPVTNSDTPPSVGTKSSFSTQSFASKALRTLSRKNGSSVVSSQSSVIKSKPNINVKYSARKKDHVYLSGEVDEEVWHSHEVEQQYASMCNGTENLGRGEITDKSSLESSQPAPQCYGLDERENTDPYIRVSDDHVDQVDVLESIAVNVTSSSKSVDTNTQKLSNRSRSQSNSLHSIEDYNGMLCGGETLTGPTDRSFVDGEEIYCSDEVGNVMIGQNAHTGPSPGLDPDIGQGNSFPEVDPIPIPGPPGSFLPSPRDMGSDDFQGNSSLTTSRVQSSQDQLDLVDGDSSDSPISATSTIFNSTATRSDLKYSEPLSPVEDHAVQDKTRSSFCTASIDPPIEIATVVPQTGTGAENTYFDEDKFKISKISIEKKPLSFKNEGQPCCCQRKERVSQDIAPNYQESQLLKRRTMASVSEAAMGKQIGCNPSARLNNLEVRPEIFPLSNCSSSGSEKAVLPVMKSQAGSFPLKGSPEAGVKFLGRGDCDSAGPSPSNPILRLMGKNLMVVNKEEDSSVPIGQSPHPCAQNSSHVPAHFPTSSGFSPNNMQNQDCRSFPHMVPQRPMIFGHNPYDAVGQQSFDVRFSSGFKNYANPRTPQTPAQVSEGLFPNQLINGGFAVSMEPHMYEGAYSLSSRHNRPKIRSSETSSSYNMEKDNKIFEHPQKNAADCGSSFKEIIVIDDVPESEANVTGADVAKYSEGLRANPLMISSGISIPTVPGYNSRHVNPFTCYQSQDPSVLSDSPTVVHNSNFHAIPSRLPNASPVRWNCTPEGSGVLQRSPYMPASNSTGHLRSTLYYSPRLL